MLRYLYLFCLLFISLNASTELLINDEKKVYTNIKTSTFIDSSNKLTINEVINNKNFEKNSSNVISQGYSNTNYWLKFSIKNITKEDKVYYLKFTELYLDKVELYFITSSGRILEQKTGIGYFKKGENNQIKRAEFKLEFKANESSEIYIKINSILPIFTSFILLEENSTYSYFHDIDLFLAFLFGAILSLLFYNFMLFLYSKDITYLLYVLYGISFLIWQLSMSGLYPLNQFSSSENYYSFMLTVPLFLAFMTLFTRAILDTKKQLPKIDKVLIFISIVYLIIFVGVYFYVEAFLSIMNGFASFVLPFLLFTGIASYKKGNKIAKFYIIAQLSFILSATFFSLAADGYLEYSIFSRYSIIVGSFIEMSLFSLALAYRIKLLEIEKVDLIKKTNIELDKKVELRTKELELEKQKAQEALKVKSTFLANMSHEIRTPMNGIIGLSHIALQTKLDSKQKDYIQKIDKSAKSLLEIINDILDFSKIEAGKFTIIKKQFNMKSLIGNIQDMIFIKIKEKGLSLDINYDKSKSLYMGDELRLQQIILNLISNAIKFTQKGKIELNIINLESNRVRFEVIDTGDGISKEDQKKLFKPFSQIDSSLSRNYSGTGLGLIIVKQLVKLMDGDIYLESEIGKGSKFIFDIELPLVSVDNTIPDEIQNESFSLDKLKDKVVLLVEDNRINQEIIVTLLDKVGVIVDVVENGKEAIEFYKKNIDEYSLVLMDIQMPTMDGYEATKELKKINEDIKVIALSANVMKEDLSQYKDIGMLDVISKPIDVKKLYETMQKYI